MLRAPHHCHAVGRGPRPGPPPQGGRELVPHGAAAVAGAAGGARGGMEEQGGGGEGAALPRRPRNSHRPHRGPAPRRRRHHGAVVAGEVHHKGGVQVQLRRPDKDVCAADPRAVPQSPRRDLTEVKEGGRGQARRRSGGTGRGEGTREKRGFEQESAWQLRGGNACCGRVGRGARGRCSGQPEGTRPPRPRASSCGGASSRSIAPVSPRAAAHPDDAVLASFYCLTNHMV
mmetsp:Transcript_32978/g.71887  ORF Transcript_32978/g.71887 Transcript_32978/m.71887 type:complete len:230 (-) Transcript_32978:342-1031(-)